MKNRLRALLGVLPLLLLAGCNLTTTIIGEGIVRSVNTDDVCAADSCIKKHSGEPKRYELVAEPAPGYTVIGLLNKNDTLYRASEGYYYYTNIGFLLVDYSYPYLQSGQGYREPTADTESAKPKISLPDPKFFQNYNDDVTAIFVPTNEIKELHRGGYAACALMWADSISCWGENLSGQPESFQNIQSLVVYRYTACAIDDNGLRCWGDDLDGIADLPSGLGNVSEILLGDQHACALHEISGANNVTCWGDAAVDYPAPPLSNPTDIWNSDAGTPVMCAVDDNGEVCWGPGYFDQSKVPADLTEVTDFSAAEFHTCAINNGEVRCWGKESAATNVPSGISNPTSITTENFATCVVEDAGVTCWGDDVPVLPSNLNAPKSVEFNRYHICVDDTNRLVCKHETIDETEYAYSKLAYYAVDFYSGCYIDDTGYGCLGTPKIPDVENIELIRSDCETFCYVADDTINCDYSHQGHDDTPNIDITIDNLVIGTTFACIQENDEEAGRSVFQCWGDNVGETWTYRNRGQITPASNPGLLDKLEAGAYHTCGLRDTTLQCWGEAYPPRT